MTDRDIDRIAAAYLDALDGADFDTLERIWEMAATDASLEQALHELHAAVEAEDECDAERQAVVAIAEAVERHLPSAEVVRPDTGPVTVADVADELFRHTPGRLPAEAHLLNEQLRSARIHLPDDLGLSKLTAWAEAQFGTAPAEYWKAFRQAALKLELRHAAQGEYRLAARPGEPKPGEKP